MLLPSRHQTDSFERNLVALQHKQIIDQLSRFMIDNKSNNPHNYDSVDTSRYYKPDFNNKCPNCGKLGIVVMDEECEQDYRYLENPTFVCLDCITMWDRDNNYG